MSIFGISLYRPMFGLFLSVIKDARCVVDVYYLPYQVKTQYLQILNIIDTSLKCAISSQSTPMSKGCIDICLIW